MTACRLSRFRICSTVSPATIAISFGNGAVKDSISPVMGWRKISFHAQRLPLYPFHIRVVQIISDQGITEVFHMNPYLMGAAGL